MVKGQKAPSASSAGSSRETLAELIALLLHRQDARAFLALHPELFEDQVDALLVGFSEACRDNPRMRLGVEQTRFVLKRSREIGLDGADTETR